VFSQLYVKPNGSTDSYVYVKDEVLFVEDDVNLQENNAGTKQASIYLREGSQLIQGSGSTLNSGDGYISIYQTNPETSNYHYNFWHSPVGNQDLGGSGNQNAGLSRLFDINDVTDSDLVSTTNSLNGSSTTDPITISTRWIYKRISSPAGGEEANYIRVRGADIIEPGYGFTMKGVSNGAETISQTYDFRGRPNNGTINVPVLTTGVPQWTISGNPYPSAMDLVLFYNDNIANGLTEILFWDEPKNSEYSHYYSQKSGGFGTWVPGVIVNEFSAGLYVPPTFKDYSSTGGTGSIGSVVGPIVDRRYAPVGQGFVIETDGVSSTNITLKNDYRIFKKIGEVSEFRSPGMQNGENEMDGGPTPISNTSTSITPQLRINCQINQINGNGNDKTRQLLLSFHENSTDDYDVGLDAHHPMDIAGSDVYFPVIEDGEEKPFVIQTRPFVRNKLIPVNFILNNETKLAVEIIEEINFNETAYLYDSEEQIGRQISGGGIAELILEAGNYNDRFFIAFKSTRQMTNDSEGTKSIEIARSSVDFFQNNPYKQMEVSNPEGYDIKSASVYDMTGKLVATKQNLGTASNFNIPTANLADGVYLIKLTTSENIDIDYKMIIQND